MKKLGLLFFALLSINIYSLDALIEEMGFDPQSSEGHELSDLIISLICQADPLGSSLCSSERGERPQLILQNQIIASYKLVLNLEENADISDFSEALSTALNLCEIDDKLVSMLTQNTPNKSSQVLDHASYSQNLIKILLLINENNMSKTSCLRPFINNLEKKLIPEKYSVCSIL